MLFLFFISCKSQKTLTDQNAALEEEMVIMSLKEGACFGTCPIFYMSITNHGKVIYEGKGYAEKQGLHSKTISMNTIFDLLRKYDACDFESLPDRYSSMIPDMQLVTIGLHNQDTVKTTAFKENRPDELEALREALKEIANSTTGWTKMEDPETSEEEDAKLNLNEIILETNQGVKIALWVRANKDIYGLRLIKKVAPNSNYWLFEYDQNKFGSDEIIAALSADPDIKNVEFNVVTEER